MLGDRHPDPALTNGITRMLPRRLCGYPHYKRDDPPDGKWDELHSREASQGLGWARAGFAELVGKE